VPGHITIDTTRLRFADLGAADLLSRTSIARSPDATTIVGSPAAQRILNLAEATVSRYDKFERFPDA
jgi:hypothetical protein